MCKGGKAAYLPFPQRNAAVPEIQNETAVNGNREHPVHRAKLGSAFSRFSAAACRPLHPKVSFTLAKVRNNRQGRGFCSSPFFTGTKLGRGKVVPQLFLASIMRNQNRRSPNGGTKASSEENRLHRSAKSELEAAQASKQVCVACPGRSSTCVQSEDLPLPCRHLHRHSKGFSGAAEACSHAKKD